MSLCLLSFLVAAILGILTTIEWSDILTNTDARAIIDASQLAAEVEAIRDIITADIVSLLACRVATCVLTRILNEFYTH